MPRIPVLLLISRKIDLRILNDSFRFEQYRFFSLVAMDYMGSRPTDSNRHASLQNALEDSIRRVGARVILVHLGLAFARYPLEFVAAVLDVQSMHPDVKFGMDKGVEYALQYLRNFAAPGSEVARLIARLSTSQTAFDMDEETLNLASCLL